MKKNPLLKTQRESEDNVKDNKKLTKSSTLRSIKETNEEEEANEDEEEIFLDCFIHKKSENYQNPKKHPSPLTVKHSLEWKRGLNSFFFIYLFFFCLIFLNFFIFIFF